MVSNGVPKGKTLKLFKETLKNLFEVLQSADQRGVLTTPIPSDFLESDPLRISASFTEYKVSNPEFNTTTITANLEGGKYASPYEFYHDIKIASFILINELEIGSEEYVQVDRFYKFATELFLRECYRLHITIQELKVSRDVIMEEHEESGFEEMLTGDFDRISTSYTIGHTEGYVVMTQNNIPLFTSLNERSSLDERDVILPRNVMSTTVIPTTTSQRSVALGDVSPHVTRLPQLNPQTGEILSRFLHPNWYSLPTAKWLETSDLLSFAPLMDQQSFVVSSSDKGRLWLETIGYKKLEKWRKQGEEDEVMKETEDVQATQEVPATQENGEAKDLMMETDTKVDAEDVGELTKDDIFNIYEWAPQQMIDDAELEAFENGTEQEYLSEQLSKLQTLRKERYSKGFKMPTKEEEEVYHRCFRLLKEIIYVQDTVPDVKPSPLLPTEQFVYPGSLPVPQQNPVVPRRKYKTRAR